MSDFWLDPSSTSIVHVCKQRKLWRDCTDVQPSLVAYVIRTIISCLAQIMFKLTCNCPRKSMQEKESITVDSCELKILSLWITFRHYLTSLVMPNSSLGEEFSTCTSQPLKILTEQHNTIKYDKY